MRKVELKTPQAWLVLVLKILLFLVFFVYALSLIYPFVWILYNSFKTGRDFFQDSWGLPAAPTVYNYFAAWTKSGVGNYFFNSVWITAAGVIGLMLSSSMAAYALSKYRFRLHGLVYGMAVASFLLPQVGTLGAFYVLMNRLSLFNPVGLILYYSGGLGTAMIILYGFFRSIPWDYAEAAFMDGAGHTRVFFQIMLPMVKAGLIPVAILNTITYWNDYFIPSILLIDPKSKTIAIGLEELLQTATRTNNVPLMFAATIIVSLPMFVLFLVMRRKIMSSFVLGGLKG